MIWHFVSWIETVFHDFSLRSMNWRCAPFWEDELTAMPSWIDAIASWFLVGVPPPPWIELRVLPYAPAGAIHAAGNSWRNQFTQPKCAAAQFMPQAIHECNALNSCARAIHCRAVVWDTRRTRRALMMATCKYQSLFVTLLFVRNNQIRYSVFGFQNFESRWARAVVSPAYFRECHQ